MLPYVLMAMTAFVAVPLALRLRSWPDVATHVGAISWISLSLYVVIELLVTARTTAPYDALRQPMSDLGVTTCGSGTYPLAPYEICSPDHLLMNWTFTLTGVVIAVGAVLLHRHWPRGRRTVTATTLLVIFGLSFSIGSMVPADVGFAWHTLWSLPGTVVQIPALLLLAIALRARWPRLAAWTLLCLVLTCAALVALFVQPFVPELPGGLLQRLLYGSVFLWMIVTAIVLWCAARVRAAMRK